MQDMIYSPFWIPNDTWYAKPLYLGKVSRAGLYEYGGLNAPGPLVKELVVSNDGVTSLAGIAPGNYFLGYIMKPYDDAASGR